ncbi:MAG: hypothetical protein K2J18_07535 [Paramuribaculum sp.]|nr:hypothetical protein [Paramuribaculum sp.]
MGRTGILLLLTLLLTTLKPHANNEVIPLEGFPADSVAESGAKMYFRSFRTSGDTLTFRLLIEAFRLDKDFIITGARFYRAYDKRTLDPLEPFSLTIPSETTADTAVRMEIAIEYPKTHHFNTNDTLWIDTPEGSRVEYTGELLNLSPVKRPGFFRRHRPWIIAGAGVLTIALIALIARIYARRMERIRRENLAIKSELSNAMHSNDELNGKIDRLFGERLDALNKICNEYFEKKDAETESVRLSVYKEVENIIMSLRSREAIATIEETVNTYRHDILKRLREQVPQLSAADIMTVTYLYAGFSPKAVCIFTDSKIKNFYNRRQRLRDKIANSGAADSDEFLSYL